MTQVYNSNESNVNNLNDISQKKVNKVFKTRKETLNKSVGIYLQNEQLNKTDRAILSYLSKSWAMDIGRYRSTLRKYSSIQNAVGRSYHAVYRSIKKLQKLGILKVEHRKQCKNVNIQACNRYILIPHPSLKNENGQNQNATPGMQGRGSEKQNARNTDTKPFASKLLVQLNPLPITLSFKNNLYKSCIKDSEKQNKQIKTHRIKPLHLQINDLVDVVGFKQDKKIKRERMYLQYAAKMCKFLMQDAFDSQDFIDWIRSPFLKLFKSKKYRTYQTHNHLLTALVQDFVEQKIGGVGYRLRDWYNMQMQKKEEQNNKKPLIPAFVRKPLVFD